MLNKPEEDAEPIELEDLLAALDNDTFGIKTDVVEKLANRPIYGIKIKWQGVEPIDGDDL